ncbi:hypothetical protein J4422_04310 [Candidatus Pacearchaeota archaeon]|nr:hypothetical protein [Candidatus Pacearchaeota archaeon]
MDNDKCPTCEREFQGLQDYPLIYVAKFERVEIPTDLVLPFYDAAIFVGPNSDAVNKRPPQEVLEFFKKNEREKGYVHNGWKWSLKGKWDIGNYHREQPDQRPIVVAKLNPYLETLDSLVGKEVEKSQLLPNFEREGYFRYAFNIPDTAYQLMFYEQEKTPVGLRIAELKLMGEGPNLGSAGGPTIQALAKIGHLEYEGRIRK